MYLYVKGSVFGFTMTQIFLHEMPDPSALLQLCEVQPPAAADHIYHALATSSDAPALSTLDPLFILSSIVRDDGIMIRIIMIIGIMINLI